MHFPLNRLTGAGVGYRSFTEPYFDSCGIFHDAVISILATIAKQERIRLSERVQAGLARARGPGKRLGRQKRSWTPQELLICAHRATHGAKSRRKLESGSKNHCACAWLG